jgi:acetoin utilization deacetylase AcuC-like enzyme
MSRTAYYWDPLSLEHDTGFHVESIARAEKLCPEEMRALVPNLDARPVVPHDAPAWICRVHDPEYHDWVKTACESGRTVLDHGDTVVRARSYDAALASVNAALTAADAVMAKEADNAFSAMRPPGHHALPARAMGFCIFNNVAILARYLEDQYKIARVAIVDWDVHHGNGTQHIFWRNPDVFYASLHQHPLWPGSGLASEQGDGPGLGVTLNVPIAPATSEVEYLSLFENKILKGLRYFGPDVLLLSAGFDSHEADPLASLKLTDHGFVQMTRWMKELAAEYCGGRLISVLEGGYNLDVLQRCVAAHVTALME